MLGSEEDGEVYAEVLARTQAGKADDADKKRLEERMAFFHSFKTNLRHYQRYRFWQWLQGRLGGWPEKWTQGFV